MKPRQKKDFVGQKVRNLRKERGMTQSELASRIGIIQSDLCRMEKGEYKVSLEVLFRILQVFGMNIGEFFNESTTAAEPIAGESELLESYRRLSPDARSEVLDYVRFKAQQLPKTVDVEDDSRVSGA
ncbi:MAG: helix-turn-helix transcriptional regulator [Acidobacteriota bacterium]